MKAIIYILLGIFCVTAAIYPLNIHIASLGTGGGPLWAYLLMVLLYPLGFVFAIVGWISFRKQQPKENEEKHK